MRFRDLAVSGLAILGLSGCGAVSVPARPDVPAPIASPTVETSAAPVATASPSAAAPSPAASAAPAAPAGAAPAQPAGPALAPTPLSFRLQPLQYIRQTLNNCGPASIAEVLGYWGVQRTQSQTQAVLRPDGNSRGMMPYPVPAYIHGLGMDSLMGVGGNATVVKALVANGLPVIVAQQVSLQEPVAHYREIEGFDDQRKVFVSTDSYLGPNHEISYAEFDQLWARGNQRFMVIYPPAKQTVLNAVLKSAGWDKTAAYQADLARQQRGDAQPQEPPGFRPGFPGSKELNFAWDYIQLGQLDAAKAEIQKAPNSGRNAQLIDWLNQALAVASA